MFKYPSIIITWRFFWTLLRDVKIHYHLLFSEGNPKKEEIMVGGNESIRVPFVWCVLITPLLPASLKRKSYFWGQKIFPFCKEMSCPAHWLFSCRVEHSEMDMFLKTVFKCPLVSLKKCRHQKLFKSGTHDVSHINHHSTKKLQHCQIPKNGFYPSFPKRAKYYDRVKK